MPSLTGKIALITGAIVRASASASPALSPRSAPRWSCTATSSPARNAAAARLEAAGDDVHRQWPPICATSTPAATMMQAAIAWKGGLDVLVNNAGMVDRGYLEDAPIELWDDIMAVNLRAPFICLQEAVKSMKARGGGSIVNIGSVNAYIGAPKLGPVFGVEGRADDDDPQRGRRAESLPDPRQPAERRLDADRKRRRGAEARRGRAPTGWATRWR